jgi:hypothetical protein
MIEDAPMQLDASSSHSIKKVKDSTVEIPLEMHGVMLEMHEVISQHLRTRLPTNEEIELYRDGQFRSVELTTDKTRPWEPYSKEFARPEYAVRVARSISAAIQVAYKKSSSSEAFT